MKRIALIALAVVILIAVIGYLIWLGYVQTGLNEYVDPTGEYHPAKTLWNWMELLIVPLVLAGGALWLTERERRAERQSAEERYANEQKLATDHNCETALQAYFDQMTALLLEQDLRNSELAQNIARARTLTVLRVLDGERKGILLRFLYEAELIKGDRPIIDLRGAELREANLNDANLNGANLSEANLPKAYLIGANLNQANLANAYLVEATMPRANLIEANLIRANLVGANLFEAYLMEAKLFDADLRETDLRGASLHLAELGFFQLSGARYDDNTIWPEGFTPPSDALKVED